MFDKISRRYSQALFQEATNTKALEQISEDRKLVLDTLKSSRELELFFKSPIIDKSKKKKVVEEVFSGKISPLMLNFIYLLIEKQRESHIVEVLDNFNYWKNEKEGIIEVEVTTAVALNDDERKKIKATIDSYTHLKSEPHFTVDKSIIGGFVVKVKDTILDASIKRQLELLKKRFKEGDIALN
jgi:F-type H+-transporting ATPase subunit delta